MTLTAVLPSLRRSIPDPLDERLWPEHTVSTVVDVVVGAVSLVRLAELEGTPCVMTGDLHHPKARDARARGIGTDVTVIVMRVALRVDTQDGRRVATVDSHLGDLPARWSECRLIGRVSTARAVSVDLAPDVPDDAARVSVTLPADLRAGDLLAVPCAGAVSLHDVRTTEGREDEPMGRCGK